MTRSTRTIIQLHSMNQHQLNLSNLISHMNSSEQMTFYLYTADGKRVTPQEAADLRLKHYNQIEISSNQRPNTSSKPISPLLSNHPWELESHRFLAKGGRLIRTALSKTSKRVIQSAGSRYLSEIQTDLEQNQEPVVSNDVKFEPNWNKLYDFEDLEFEPTSLGPTRRSSLIDSDSQGYLTRPTEIRLNDMVEGGTSSSGLRMTMATVAQKVADNEGMGIDTFTYLEDEEGEGIRDARSLEVISLVHMSEHGEYDDDDDDAEEEQFDLDDVIEGLPISHASSPSTKRRASKNPAEILRNIISVGLLLRATLHIARPIHEEREKKLRQRKAQTFIELRKEIEIKWASQDLTFDKYAFKFTKEQCLTPEAARILMMPRSYRTEIMLKSAWVAVTATTEAFSEFPVTMQNAIISKAWYEKYEERRMIIRQGQPPLNFYYIISGSAIVSVTRKDKETGQPFEETVAFLKAGQSFGELALIYGGKRSATVICNTPMELLVMSRQDFTQIFLNTSGDHEAEHIAFLRTITLIPKEVINQLHGVDNSILLFTYFRRQTIICQNSNQNDWIYIIRSGQCRIIKDIQLDRNSDLLMERLSQCKLDRPTTSTTFYPKSYYSFGNQNRYKESTIGNEYKKLYLELKVLEPNSVFGLEPIVFEPFGGTTSVSLISDGAECVAIKKRFFIKHCPTVFLNWLRRKVQPFPKVEDLEHKLGVFWDWQIYRKKLIQACIN